MGRVLPEMFLVRQRFEGPRVTDVAGAMREALRALRLHERVRPGMRVGVPVGSRGIRQIPVLLREAVTAVRALGAEPVLMAAMGSHGGGTTAGQMAVLHSLEITEQAVGAPLKGGIAVVEVAHAADGSPVYFDRELAACDALLVINRVKPHTSFHGPIESGLIKMLVVGCGKPAGARQFHSLGPHELAPRLCEFGRIILDRLPVVGGVAVLENAKEETAALVPVSPGDFFSQEPALLEQARALLPRLPVTELDLLVVDQMGKDFSGTGMDTNVIGRMGIPGMEPSSPRIKRIVVLDLSAGSHGNANGIGLADLVTRRLVSKIDFEATYLNTLTVTTLERAKIPITLESDRAVMETALQTVRCPAPHRIARIRNTLELEELWLSPLALADVADRANLQVVSGPRAWDFTPDGNLC